jgi:hypothetical protein
MCRSDREIEDRIFELLGGDMTAPEISDAVGLDPDTGLEFILRVLEERGTPNLAEVDRALDRIAAIRF